MNVHKQLMIITLTAMLLMTSLIVIVPQELSADAAQEPWLYGWQCRKSHVINASAGAGAGYVVGIKVYNGAGTDGTETINGVSFGKVYINGTRADFRDLRFTDGDGVTLLPYWIETCVDDTSAKCWVKVSDDLSSEAATIYVYWGNEYAYPMSNGQLTFDWFDTFEDGNVWTKEGVVIATPSTDWAYCEPTVIVEDGAYLIDTDEEVLKLWFRSENFNTGAVDIMYTESQDGSNWETPITVLGDSSSPYCPYIYESGGVYYMYAKSGDNYDRWISANGISWTLDKEDTLTIGTTGAWDSDTLGNSNVFIAENGTWVMIYEARASGATWKLGVAWSADGKTWTKYSGNPVLGGSSSMAGGPFVKKLGNLYYLWYHGTMSSAVLPTDEYRAVSSDLLSWTVQCNSSAVIPRTETYEGASKAQGQIGDLHIVEFKGNLYGFYEAVYTQTDHRGIAFLATGLTWDMLVNTTENKIYNKSHVWTGTGISYVTVTDGTMTFNYPVSAWMRINNFVSCGLDSALVWKGSIGTTDSTHSNDIGLRNSAGTMITDMVKSELNEVRTCYNAGTETWVKETRSFDESTHTYDLRRLSASTNLLIDGTAGTGITSQVPTGNLFVSMGSRNNDINIEFLFIRPCIASEPTHSTWTETEVWVPYAVEPPAGSGSISFTSTPVTSAVNGTAYSYDANVNVSGAVFSLITGPSWLSINAATGVVSGTPNATGTFSVTIRATVNGTIADQTYTLTVSEGLISQSLMDRMIEMIIVLMLFMIMVSIIGMVKVKKR